ncbi:MAG TPA: hypothetical protein VGL71_01625 [Urbifossiella sp.]
MSQLSEAAIEKFPPAQAIGLARVIDLQARWENLRDKAGRPASDYTTVDLHGRQKAYEAFRVVRAEYASRYRAAEVPETTLNTAERVSAWCRAVRAVFLRAESGDCPAAALEKAYRMADRIAVRVKADPVTRESLGNLADAIRALDSLIQWCDALTKMAAPKASAEYERIPA